VTQFPDIRFCHGGPSIRTVLMSTAFPPLVPAPTTLWIEFSNVVIVWDRQVVP
jgi:hypothetical protein